MTIEQTEVNQVEQCKAKGQLRCNGPGKGHNVPLVYAHGDTSSAPSGSQKAFITCSRPGHAHIVVIEPKLKVTSLLIWSRYQTLVGRILMSRP